MKIVCNCNDMRGFEEFESEDINSISLKYVKMSKFFVVSVLTIPKFLQFSQ